MRSDMFYEWGSAALADLCGSDNVWSVICADLIEKENLTEKISEYAGCFPYAKISGTSEYMAQNQDGLCIPTAHSVKKPQCSG